MRTPRGLRGRILGAGAALALAGAACSSGPGPRVVRSTTTTLSTTAPLSVSFGQGAIGPADPSTTIPTEGGRPVPAVFGAGQNILITPHGFAPQTLEANVSAPVVWTNLSGKPQRVVFVGFGVDSGTIPPGGTFTWSTKNAVELEYHSASGWLGRLQMNPVQP